MASSHDGLDRGVADAHDVEAGGNADESLRRGWNTVDGAAIGRCDGDDETGSSADDDVTADD